MALQRHQSYIDIVVLCRAFSNLALFKISPYPLHFTNLVDFCYRLIENLNHNIIMVSH